MQSMKGQGAAALLILILLPLEVRSVESFRLTSTAFSESTPIPQLYTCDGQDFSPPLAWTSPPEKTMSFALIVEDPDAPGGTWVHWVVWNIPAHRRTLEENQPKSAALPDSARQGLSDFKTHGYGGPCPPSGMHRYYFRLYALDTLLELPAETGKTGLVRAMQGHVLGRAELMSRFSRR